MFGDSRLRALLSIGVNAFVDLTPDGEYGVPSYAGQLAEILPDSGLHCQVLNASVQDGTAPSPRQVRLVLDSIERWIADGRLVYVHCYAGIGRTGTICGCHLVRSGLSGTEALEELARRRVQAGLHPFAPETQAQRQLILDWKDLDEKVD